MESNPQRIADDAFSSLNDDARYKIAAIVKSIHEAHSLQENLQKVNFNVSEPVNHAHSVDIFSLVARWRIPQAKIPDKRPKYLKN